MSELSRDMIHFVAPFALCGALAFLTAQPAYGALVEVISLCQSTIGLMTIVGCSSIEQPD